jgi:type IV pilus assembly protein PilN
MIRINLLPVKHVKKVQAGQRQLFILVLAVVAEIAVLFFLYQLEASEVEDLKRKASFLDQEIQQLKREVGDFDQLKAKHDQLLAQQKVINDLQKARTGPVWVMRELSDVLTPGKGPSIDQASYEALLRQDPNAGYDPRWNPHRLWLEKLQESGSEIRLMGKAKDYDDVAEFHKRINLSKYFTDDFLERNDLIHDTKLNQKLVRFSLRAKLTY